MAHNPDTHPDERPPIPVIDSPHAPFVFYEGAPALGVTNGIVNITLAATRTWICDNGSIMNDHVVVVYLRGNIEAASSLRKALDDALLLAETMTQGTPH
jgi:hypothetical protein